MSTSTKPILSVIIISYNTRELTVQTLESVIRDVQAAPNLRNKVEVIVVDNNSKDDSVAEIQNYRQAKPHDFPLSQFIILTQAKNTGFAIANNLGIAKSQSKYILLLNSDTIVQKGAIATLVESFQHHQADDTTAFLLAEHSQLDRLGILAATLLNPDGTLQPQGGSLPTLWSLFCHMSLLDDIPILGKLLPSTQHTGLHQTEKLRYGTTDNRPIQRDWVGGTAMMIRRETLTEVGDLDENLFMYGEDVELCVRAKHHHWDVAIHPQAKIIHYGSASSTPSKALKAEFLAYQYIWAKHYPLWQRPIVKILLLKGAVLRWLLFWLLGNKPKALTYKEIVFQTITNK